MGVARIAMPAAKMAGARHYVFFETMMMLREPAGGFRAQLLCGPSTPAGTISNTRSISVPFAGSLHMPRSLSLTRPASPNFFRYSSTRTEGVAAEAKASQVTCQPGLFAGYTFR